MDARNDRHRGAECGIAVDVERYFRADEAFGPVDPNH
jgi:hypothetical protein